MNPFDKKQKEDSQKLVKKFKIDDYQSGREISDKQAFTVDTKTTKCHDDALEILPLKNGGYLVQIHIADVAALIQQGDDLDKKIKKRDETIYIKNYYQPMLYDSLKNLLSLKEKQEKLVFTLSFEVNSQGFIDYKTVNFHKNIVIVQKNLSHERLDSGSEAYPDLMALNSLFDRSKLVDSNYILQSQTKSQVAVSRLIFISSIIPTYLLYINIQIAKQFKESFEQYLKKMIEGRKKDMEKWQNIVDNIDKWRKEQAKINKQLKSIEKKIDNDLNKQRQIIIKRLRDEQKDIKKKQVKEKKPKKNDVNGLAKSEIGSQAVSLDQQEQLQLNQLDIQLKEDVKKRQQIQIQEQREDEIRQQKKLKLKQKRNKALKEVNLSDLESQSSESQEKQETQSDEEYEDQQFRCNAAVGGQKFLQKIFRNPFFNIDIKWESMDEINKAFKTILSKDKGKLYQEYFKRLQIMNRQHFKYILRMQRDKRKLNKMSDKQKGGQKFQQRDRNRRRYRIINEDKNLQKETQEKIESSQINSKKQLLNKIQKHEREVINKPKDTKILQMATEQLVSNKISQKQPLKQRKQYKKKQKDSPNIQKAQIKIEQKQFQLGFSVKEVGKVNKKAEKIQAIGHLQNENHDEQAAYQPQKQQRIGQQPKKKFVLDKTKVKLIKQVMAYMQAQSEKYFEKYGQEYSKDPKLTNLDISFNEKDQKIAKKYDQASIKEQKIKRLKNILRRSAKIKQRTAKMQQKKPLKTKRPQKNAYIEEQIKNGIDSQIYQKLDQKIGQRQIYYINKYKQIFVSGQKLQFSSDQQCLEKSVQFKSAYKSIKAKKIIILLKKIQKEEKKKTRKNNKIEFQKKIQQKQQLKLIDRQEEQDQFQRPQKSISVNDTSEKEIKGQRGNLVHHIKNYMNKERERYIQKYKQLYRKDNKLKKLDMSFNEEDKKIIGNFPVDILKKQKKDRLLFILQKHLKDKPRSYYKRQNNKNQQRGKKNQEKQENIIQTGQYQKAKASIEHKKDYFLNKYKQAYCQNQKIQFSSDEELPVNVQSKDIYKTAKSIYILSLLRKNYKKERVKISTNNISELKFQHKIKTKLQETLQKVESKQIKVQETKPSKNDEKELKNTRKLGKKQLKKKIEQLLQPIIEILNKKYDQQKSLLKQKIEQIKTTIKQQRQILHKQLQTANEQFNLLQLLTEQEENKKQSKRNKRLKRNKKAKKQQKDQKSSILMQFIDNFKDYADSANFKFKQMTIKQLDAYLQKIIKMKNIYEEGEEKMVSINKQASKKGQKQQKLLKWNNPIRSYESLTVMRLIRSYKWLFEGVIYPSDIIRYNGDIKQVERSLSDLQDYRRQKIERGELNKKVKEANRQISKLEFNNILKRDQNAVFTFLNIGTPCPQRVKFVFHPILEEVEVDNLEFKQDIYKQVKGKVKIIRDFPLKLRVKLEK